MSLTRDAKVALYCIYHLNSLKEKGLVHGGYDISEDGKQEYAKMMAEGFVPTDDEIRSGVASLVSNVSVGNTNEGQAT